MKQQLTYQSLFDSIEKAIFQDQARNVYEVMRTVRQKTGVVSLDKREVERMIRVVSTQYKEA